MRFLSLAGKYAKENLRSKLMLLLVLLLAPTIIAIFYLASGDQAERYKIGYVDLGPEPSAGDPRFGSEALLKAIGDYAASAKAEALIQRAEGLAVAKARLAEKSLDMFIVFPADFAASMKASSAGGASKPRLTMYYDPANLRSATLFGMVYSIAAQYILAATGKDLPFEIAEEFIQAPRADSLSIADSILPSFLILSILNVLFLAASTIIREVEHGTMKRIALSKATSFELIASISLIQAVISMIAMALSLGTAYLFGYRASGSIPALFLVGALCSLSMMAFSVITACFCRSVKDVWIVGNFPYMLCLFFSGFIPLPVAELFRLGGHAVTVNSFIPLSYGIEIFGKLLAGSAALGDFGYELTAMLALTAAYFSIGLAAFYNKHMRLR